MGAHSRRKSIPPHGISIATYADGLSAWDIAHSPDFHFAGNTMSSSFAYAKAPANKGQYSRIRILRSFSTVETRRILPRSNENLPNEQSSHPAPPELQDFDPGRFLHSTDADSFYRLVFRLFTNHSGGQCVGQDSMLYKVTAEAKVGEHCFFGRFLF